MGIKARLAAFWEWAAAAAQAIFLPAGLFLAYFLGLGATWLLVRVLRPGLLQPRRSDAESFWRPAEGYEAGEEDGLRQS